MSHISPILTSLIGIVKKSTMSLNRDFAEIESLQTSINGAKNFSLLSIKKVEECLKTELNYYKPEYPVYKDVDSIKTSTYFITNVSDNFENFNKGLGFCGISLTFVENDEPQATVIFNPKTKIIYFAQKNKGAFMEGFRNHERLRVSGQKDIKQAVITTDAKSLTKVIKQTPHARVLGGGIMDFVLCASGKLDGAVLCDINSSTLMAGTLLVKEAGGFCFAQSQKDFRTQDFDLIFKTKNVLITNSNLNKVLPEVL